MSYLSRITLTALAGRNWVFRPSLAVTLAAVAFVALTAALGHWQQRRAEEKTGLAEEWDRAAAGPQLTLPAKPVRAADVALHRVLASGEFDTARTFLLDNKVMHGVAGYHVITPFKLAGDDRYVLVNRGWVAAGPRRDTLPDVPTASGLQTLEGIAVVPSERFLELAPEAGGPVRQNLVIERIAADFRMVLQPVVLQQTSSAPDGLVRQWDRPDAGAERHRAYALQWYSFAVLTVILYVFLNIKRNPVRER